MVFVSISACQMILVLNAPREICGRICSFLVLSKFERFDRRANEIELTNHVLRSRYLGCPLRKFAWALFSLCIRAQSWATTDACTHAFPFGSLQIREESNVLMGGRFVERRSFCLDGKDCVVFLNKPILYKHNYRWLKDRIGSRGRFRTGETEPLNPAQNCHSFACSQTGLSTLPSNWWIDGTTSKRTLQQNPLKILLTVYYRELLRIPYRDAVKVAADERVREGDLVVFVRDHDVFVHSGRVIYENGLTGERQNWIRSKLGEGPVIDTSLTILGEFYPCTELRVYRLKRPENDRHVIVSDR